MIEFNADTHEYIVEGIKRPSVTTILRQEGLIDFSMVPQKVLDAALKLGTAAHRACELWDKNNLDMDSLSLPLVPYLEAWKRFRSDFKAEVVHSELKVFSRRWGYCGTIDRVMAIGDHLKLHLIDIKTSTTMAAATALQTAGYKIAYEEKFSKQLTGKEHSRLISHRWGVQLKPDGTYHIEPYENKTDEQVFTALVLVNQFKRRNNLIKKEAA